MGAPPVAPATAARIVNAMRQLLEEVPREVSWPPEVHFKHRGIQPPGAMYVTQSEFLALKTISSVANPALTVSYRILGADGQVIYNQSAIANLAAGSLNTQLFPMREGFLLDVCVSAFGSTLRRGQCFVTLSLQFGGASGQTPFDLLASDYVTNTGPLAWPGGAIRQSVEGPGLLTSQNIANPAAGTEISFTVPTGQRLRLHSFAFQLVTSAVVANRQVTILVDDGANILFRERAQVNESSSSTELYGGGAGLPSLDHVGNVTTIGLANLTDLLAGWRFRTLTNAIDVGDQYSNINLLTETWVEA